MTIRSMTGFARTGGSAAGSLFHWELRSVNGRGLDVRVRLPTGHDPLEPAVRDAVSKAMARGNIAVTLSIDTTTSGDVVRVNEQTLAVVLEAVDRLTAREGFGNPQPEGVLALRGVLEVGAAHPVDVDVMKAPLLASLAEAIAALDAARRDEGQRLAGVLADQVETIDTLVTQIAALPSRRPEAVRARLAEQVQRLLGTASSFDADRLHQEAMLLATRADVEEEIKRLGAHIAAARGLLIDPAPVGRRLDFLSQEFNREVNTICSKSGDIEMTQLGLALKAVIDQLREQVQNIE